MKRALAVVAVLVLGLAGCQRDTADAAAKRAGLAPPDVDLTQLPATVPDPNSPMGVFLSVMQEYKDFELPKPPPLPNFDVVEKRAVSYNGWTVERIDGTSFDTLTNSLNGILQRMPPDLAQDFDRVVKYILMQVTKDPMVAKKAATGQQISDAELLTLVQSYLHARSPAEIVELAEQMKAREQRTSAHQTMPAPASVSPQEAMQSAFPGN